MPDQTPAQTSPDSKAFAEQPSELPKAASRRASLVRVVSESAALFDTAAIVLAALLAEFAYVGLLSDIPADYERAAGLGLIAAIATVSVFAYLRLYRSDSVLRPQYSCVQKIVAGWLGTLLVLIVAAFLTKTSAEFSRGWSITWAITAPAAILLGRVLVRHIANRLIGWGRLARHVAIVGAGPVADRLAQHLRTRSPELVLVGIFDDRLKVREAAIPGTLAPIGTTQDLLERGQKTPLDEIIVTVPLTAKERLDALIGDLAILPVDICICPGMPIVEGTVPRVSYLDDMPLISALKRPIGEWAWMTKAIFDRVLASLLLLLVSPLLLLIAIAVRLESKGPALFRQRRHGFNHEIITVLKFRSMTVMEDSGPIQQASKDDKRITRLGAFLRKTSLDELPQLINVVRGEMSLVGPRPHALAHNDHYGKIIGHYANRHRVKPGITGLAQVNGFRGETDTPDKMAARIKYDLYYIENWSVWLDIKILIRTGLIVPFQKTAY